MKVTPKYSTPFLLVVYGAILALLVFLLKWWNYRFFVREVSLEIYIFVIATFFTTLGVWAGLRLTRGSGKSGNSVWAFNAEASQDYGLSKREQEVLSLICEGLTNKEIAARLYISTHTVKSHSSKLYTKLNVNSRSRAVALARQQELVRPIE